MDDIHGLKPLLEVPFPWALLLSALLLLCCLALCIWWFLRRWLKAKPTDLAPETAPAPAPLALELALRELENLETEILRGDSAGFYFKLEKILSHYWEQTQGVPVSCYTHAQMLLWLGQRQQLHWPVEAFKSLLQRSQWAKFARSHHLRETLQQDRDWVKKHLLQESQLEIGLNQRPEKA